MNFIIVGLQKVNEVLSTTCSQKKLELYKNVVYVL